ncbi:MAG TPA: HAD family hydrolase [Terriglobales bacterium]|nr:HAD family hydrolase [Terriglobales bacterium]
MSNDSRANSDFSAPILKADSDAARQASRPPKIARLRDDAAQFKALAADAYLFDIDGTLLNTTDLVHYRALNRAMREVYGVETTIDGVSYHGKTDLGILRAALEQVGIAGAIFESRLPQALEVIRQQVNANAASLMPKVCAGISQVLAKLHGAGKVLGVASGNLEVVGWHKIEAAGLRPYFSFGCFSDACETREQVFQRAVEEARHRLGAAAKVCFVGDTPSDIKAARHVGAWIVAVGTGIFGLEELSGHGPDFCVNSCAEWLEKMGE